MTDRRVIRSTPPRPPVNDRPWDLRDNPKGVAGVFIRHLVELCKAG